MGIGLIVKSICKLMRINRWSEPRFVFVCQLVEVIREADANETSGEDGLALPGSLVGESQLRIPKLEPDIMFSNRVSLVSVELYHAFFLSCRYTNPIHCLTHSFATSL